MLVPKWKKDEHGNYVRDPDPLEDTFVTVEAMPNNLLRIFALTSCKFDIKDVKEIERRLRRAWRRVIVANPQLCIDVTSGKFVVSPIDTQEKLDEWERKYFVVWTKGDVHELFSTLQENPIATLYYLPEHEQLAVKCSHAITDAFGMRNFYDRLFTYFNEDIDVDIKPFDESLLLPSFPEALGIQGWSEEDGKAFVDDHISKLPAARPVAEIPTIDTGKVDMQFLAYKFTREETDKMISNAKKHGLTVSQFLYSTLGWSVGQQLGLEPGTVQYLLPPLPTNMRNVLPENLQKSVGGCYIAVFLIPILVTDDFEKCKEHVKKLFNDILSKARNKNDIEGTRKRMTQIIASYGEIKKATMAGGLQVSISSSGISDGDLKPSYPHIKVERFHVTINPRPTAFGNASTTLDGHYEHCSSFNAGTLDRALVEKIVTTYLETIKA